MHISNTQLTMMQRCGEQYRRRYVLGEKMAPGVALIVGGATHVPIDKDLGNKIETGELLPDEQIQDIARDAVNTRWDNEKVRLDEAEEKQGEAVVRGAAVDMTVNLAMTHHKHLAPLIDPAHTERKWELDLTGYDCTLVGIWDIQEKDKDIIDTKTSYRRPISGIADSSQQLTIYAMAANVIDGVVPKVALHSLIKAPSKRKKGNEVTWRGLELPDAIDIQESTRSIDDFAPVLRRIESLLVAVEKDIFIPTNPDNWACDPRYCGFHATCRYVNSKRIPKT